jgi:hypothetical protein
MEAIVVGPAIRRSIPVAMETEDDLGVSLKDMD